MARFLLVAGWWCVLAACTESNPDYIPTSDAEPSGDVFIPGTGGQLDTGFDLGGMPGTDGQLPGADARIPPLDAGASPTDAGNATSDARRPVSPNDADGDGAPASSDCDDNDPLRYPGAVEACDGVDNDRDNEVDETFEDSVMPASGQGGAVFRVRFVVAMMAAEPRRPGNRAGDEVCDQLDNDCDAQADEDVDNCCEPARNDLAEPMLGCAVSTKTCDGNGRFGECRDAVRPMSSVPDRTRTVMAVPMSTLRWALNVRSSRMVVSSVEASSNAMMEGDDLPGATPP